VNHELRAVYPHPYTDPGDVWVYLCWCGTEGYATRAYPREDVARKAVSNHAGHRRRAQSSSRPATLPRVTREEVRHAAYPGDR